MDTEAAFFRVHARLSGVLSRVLTPKFRTTLEFMCLFNAFALLLMLVVMHVSFVGQVRWQTPYFTVFYRVPNLCHVNVEPRKAQAAASGT